MMSHYADIHHNDEGIRKLRKWGINMRLLCEQINAKENCDRKRLLTKGVKRRELKARVKDAAIQIVKGEKTLSFTKMHQIMSKSPLPQIQSSNQHEQMSSEKEDLSKSD